MVESAIRLLGNPKLSGDDLEARMSAVAADQTTCRRLIDVIPEAFGLTLIAHMKGAESLTLPDEFEAQTEEGDWRVFPLEREPLLREAMAIALDMFHRGPRSLFEPIAGKSGLLDAVNNALNAGASLEGASLKLRILGVPAEVYGYV